ncbi:MAG TPA: hypothetical protein VFQ35_23405 [Polyangiaceae bacterium]|nr:hypothetical protein [Polyangiaceae bacterium]
MRLGSLIGWLVLGACACSPREPAAPAARSVDTATMPPAVANGGVPATPPPVPALPSAGASAAPPPAPAQAGEPSAWTDPAVVAALALDCNFKPAAPAPDEPEPSPLSCASGLYEQSCIYDPCYSTNQGECAPRCQKACDACSEQCSAGCGRCKARCTDDACRHECATACASCKQECLATKDRCATGTCGAEYKACIEQLTKRWVASGCEKTCKAYRDCTDKCQAGPACTSSEDEKACSTCTDRCAGQVKRGCPKEFVEMCLFNGGLP